MTEICQFHNMHLQKEVKSNQKRPSCKKNVQPLMWKRYEIKGGGQEMAKITMKIQVILVPNPSETWRKQHKFI